MLPSQMNGNLHVHRLKEHALSPQLHTPAVLVGRLHAESSDGLHPNDAVGLAVGVGVVGIAVGATVAAAVGAPESHINEVTSSRSELRVFQLVDK